MEYFIIFYKFTKTKIVYYKNDKYNFKNQCKAVKILNNRI